MHRAARKTAIGIVFLLLFSSVANPQLLTPQSEPPLADIIQKAVEQRQAYQSVFKNLLSRETKLFEIYNKKGAVKKRRTVLSTFLVYQLAKDSNRVAEFRNIASVDGMPLKDAEGRAESLFQSVEKAESSDKEIQRIEDESQRFDQDVSVTGLTLFQAVPLSDNLRPNFDFKIVGKDTLKGNTVYVVSYMQNKSSPYISADEKRLSGDHKLTVFYDAGIDKEGDLGEKLSGELWIDATSFQIWREVRKFELQPAGFDRPVLLAETTFDYQKSAFGILTPKEIVHHQYQIVPAERASRKSAKITFDYDNFTKPDVEVKSAEVK